jgi:hypothetical protein
MLGHHVRIYHPQQGHSQGFQRFMYRFSLERAFLDIILVDWVVHSILRLARHLDRFERIVGAKIAGDGGTVKTGQAADMDALGVALKQK